MAGHVDCQVAYCPTLFLFSRWQGPSVASFPGGTILCQWLIPSSCSFLENISSVPGWSRILCSIDKSQCFQSHFYVWIASFSTFIAIFHNILWWHMSPTCQTFVALVFPRVKTYFLSPSGVVELMYSRNGNWILLPWLFNNPKGVGPYWRCSKTLSWSKYWSASVGILELIDTLGDIHIKPGINFPLNLQTSNPGSALPTPIFSSVVLLEPYGIDAR